MTTPTPMDTDATERERSDDEKTRRALAATDALAEIWAGKVDLRQIAEALCAAPDNVDRVMTMLKFAFGEGCYEGRMSQNDELEQTALSLRVALAASERDAEQLRAFANDVLDEFWEGGLDSDDLQQIGMKHGLLIETEMAERCSEEEGGCSCAEAGAEFPTDCYRYAPILRKADLAAAGKEGGQ